MAPPSIYPRFSMVWCIPRQMEVWWTSLGKYGQDEVRKVLGNLPSLMQVTPCRELIEAATTFWDEKRVVFRFGDVEMTPLLEEIGGYVENVSLLWRNKKWQKAEVIIPKSVTLEIVREKLRLQGSLMVSHVMKSKMPGSYLFDRFGHASARELFESESHDPGSWARRRIFAFIVYFLGLIVFPRGAEEEIHTRLINVADALHTGIDKGPCTVVPMIVADIYRSLGHCKNGAKHFEGCNLLLQIWLIEHLQKVHGSQSLREPVGTDNIAAHQFRVSMGVRKIKRPNEVEKWGQMLNALTEDSVQWMFDWFPSADFLVYTKHHAYLILMGLRGLQPYAPMRVMRQAGRKQIIPRVADMDVHQVDYQDNRIPQATELAKIWHNKVFLDNRSIESDRYQAGYVLGYIKWLHADWEKSVIRSVKRGKHVGDKEAEAQILYPKFKRKARDSETRHRQLLDDNAKEITEIGKELEYWKQYALSLEGKMEELREDFSKIVEECLQKGDMGGTQAIAYLLASRHSFDKALEAAKKTNIEEDVFRI